MGDWLLRLIKGIFIGSGFILPGVSGGALAAVFGIYERLIAFLANIRKEFKKNILYFLPVGLGGLAGVVVLSFAVSYFLEVYEAQILWFFIGCIMGTVPALWKEAGKKGRKPRHIVILLTSFAISLAFLVFGQTLFAGGQIEQNFGTWTFAGALVGLGVIVPGMSPSNFLVYMNLYKPMVDGFKNFDLSVIVPIVIGLVLCIILLSKLMNWIFNKAHTGLFHFILGVVFSSTIMIIPKDFNYLSPQILIVIATCVAGVLLGRWMSSLEEKHKHKLA